MVDPTRQGYRIDKNGIMSGWEAAEQIRATGICRGVQRAVGSRGVIVKIEDEGDANTCKARFLAILDPVAIKVQPDRVANAVQPLITKINGVKNSVGGQTDRGLVIEG